MADIDSVGRRVRLARYRVQAPPVHRRRGVGLLPLLVVAFLAVAAIGALALRHVAPDAVARVSPVPISVALPLCLAGDRSCVVDGDTFKLDGQSIRIADIDTPETHEAKCAAEKSLGDRATARMRELLNAGPFELQAYERDTDKYGRKLRIVTRDGQSLGQVLVAEGLARNWDGARYPWC